MPVDGWDTLSKLNVEHSYRLTHPGTPSDVWDAYVRGSPEEAFADSFARAFPPGDPFEAYVSHYTVADMKAAGMIPVVEQGGKVGCVIIDHHDGRIEASALFNNGGTPGSGVALLKQVARDYGVNYVECFAPKLPKLYESAGFATISVQPFNPDYAPANWDYANDRPDYYEMVLPFSSTKEYYDEAVEFATIEWGREHGPDTPFPGLREAP